LASTGTDTGGSVRQPAALCGISGIKPTYGSVSRYGMIAYGSSLDQAGVMAVAATDLVEMLDTISGFDERDATSAEQCRGVPNAPGRIQGEFSKASTHYTNQGALPLKGLRIGVPREHFGDGLTNEVATAIEAALTKFEQLGAQRVAISLPRTRLSIPAYYVIAPAEASSNLSRYDGVRYGLRVPGKDISSMYENTRRAGFGPEVRRRIMIGAYVLSAGYYDAYYVRAQKIRTLIKQDFEKAYAQGVDAILTPATPSAAFGIGEKGSADPVEMYLNDVFTVTVNMAGLPGIAVPAGLSADGLPLGLQLIGRPFDEETLFSVASVIEESAGRVALPQPWW
jgi:aspartyl-tRNA(Asn)/glutamyl-tRNA(Gln) amidotransferase subunit A